MAQGAAIIRLRVKPDGSIQRALKGVTDATQKASAQQVAMARKVAAEQKREAERAEKAKQQGIERTLQMQMRTMQTEKREAKRLTDSQAKDAKRLADAQAKEAKRAADTKIREEQRAAAVRGRIEQDLQRQKVRWQLNSARMASQAAERTSRTEIREAQKAHREQVRLHKDMVERRRTLIAGIGGGIMAGGAAALGRVDSYAGALGAQSREQMLVSAVDLRRRSIRVGHQADMTAGERASMQSTIISESARTGLSADSNMRAMETAQAQFSEFGGAKSFSKLLPMLGDMAIATGSDIEAVTQAMGVMRRQFKLSESEMEDLGYKMVDSANVGNAELSDVASNMASMLGSLGRGANMSGMQGVDVALGVSQALGASDKTASEVATLGTNMVTALNKGTVRRGIKSNFGVSLANKDRSLRDLPTIIAELSKAGFTSAAKGEKRQDAIKDKEGRDAFEILVKQYEANPALFEKLITPDAERGKAYTSSTFADMNKGDLGRAATFASRQFADFTKSPQLDSLLNTALNSAEALEHLKAKYPLMTEAVIAATAAVAGFGVTLGLVSRRIAPMRPIGAGVPGAAGAGAAGAAGAGRAIGTSVSGGGLLAAGAFVLPAATLGAAFLSDSDVGGAYSAAGKSIADATGINDWGKGLGGMPKGGVPSLMRSHPDAPVELGPNSLRTLSESLRVGNATLRVQIDGPGRVVGSRQSENFPTLDTGSAYQPQ